MLEADSSHISTALILPSMAQNGTSSGKKGSILGITVPQIQHSSTFWMSAKICLKILQRKEEKSVSSGLWKRL
jgi:hypothetical protein